MSNHDGRYDAANARRKAEKEARLRREALIEKVDEAQTIEELRHVLKVLINKVIR